MKKVFIGHRGVGKTELLKRHATHYPEIKHFDLDDQIEKHVKCTVSDYFQKYGESEFRKIEAEVFRKLVEENSNYVVSLGAGFDVSELPKDIEIIYVCRTTDKDGRIFLNRPRLEGSLSPLEEYKKRFDSRNAKFLKFANKIYYMPEGDISAVNETEKTVLTENFAIQDAYYTLSSQDINNVETLLKLYKNIELRTDLLSHEIIQGLLNRFSEHNWLVSVRTPEPINFINANNIDVDFRYYIKGCQILSSHADKIDEGIKQLSEIKEKLHLKLCPLVETFTDLIKGYNWQRQDPENRSFLPRSVNGKWIWYRQLSKYLQKINFIRNFTEVMDQPSLSEWLLLPAEKSNGWGAVLGKPIHFSRSPLEHQNYFLERKSFFTKIEISSEELESYIKFLIDLGLKYAAVTSPLKETAFKISNNKTEFVDELKAANTLFIEGQQISSHNTDFMGFKELVKNIKATDKVAIWGGGGTLGMMKKILPVAHLYSSQTGKLRQMADLGLRSYDYLIWAAPRSAQFQWPEDNLEIKELIDLNYTENSLGLEFAAHRKIRYTSGVGMFRLQALKQQEFWSLNERK